MLGGSLSKEPAVDRSIARAAFALLLPAVAAAQPLNVDFGVSQPPAPSYAAVGLAGTWNTIAVLPPAQRAPLVGLGGQAVAAKIYMIGGTGLLESDDPLTSGDDAALLDDMLTGLNNPLDVCVWFESLENGEYEVILYAMTPNDHDLLSRVRVDFATPGPTEVGGAWPGQHEPGKTYATFAVTVTDGTIGLHSGLPGALIQSGLNGIQLRPLATSGAGIGAESAPTGIRAVFPNPASGPQVVELVTTGREARSLEIWDVAGRLVWSRSLEGLAAGPTRIEWNGLDRTGRRVPASVYFVRMSGETGSTKIVRID
jgi:hypothetical protein